MKASSSSSFRSADRLIPSIKLVGRLSTGRLDRRLSPDCVGATTDVLAFGLVTEVEMTILAEPTFCFSGVLLCLVDEASGAGLAANGDWATMPDSRLLALEVAAAVAGGRAMGVTSIADLGRDVDE
jgi:hypothetical protein